jgi:hypothetical protein
MYMIWHSINCDQFMLVIFDDTRNIFVQFAFLVILNNTFTGLYCKYSLYMDLCVSIRHGMNYFIPKGMMVYVSSFFYLNHVPKGTNTFQKSDHL